MTDNHKDQALVKRAQRGDSDAFAEIYDLYHLPIYRFFSYRMQDVSVVEDLTGEVFVRLVERIDRFIYRGQPILAWLYTIARNLLIDYQRRTKKRVLLPLDDQLKGGGVDPEQDAESALETQRLIWGLQKLTEDQRQVIYLKFIEGFANDEVAEVMNKPVGAVKSLQHRGLKALRRVLK